MRGWRFFVSVFAKIMRSRSNDGLEVFKRGYMTLLRVTYGPVERLHMALLREAAKIFDPAL